MNLQIKDFNGNKLYYYDNDWQKPVITEYQVFKLFNQQENILTDYFAFPWATMIDNYNAKKKIYTILFLNIKLIHKNVLLLCNIYIIINF
jgi:hypothetical protein